MGINTKIEWTDHSNNPWMGCTKVSPACDNCYMFRDQKRYGKNPGQIRRASDKTFFAPLNKNKILSGEKVFICSWSDFFHEDVPQEWRVEYLTKVVLMRPDIIWLFLTKRPENIAEMMNGFSFEKNWWFGVTAENQEQADLRIPQLLQIPAAKRFVSIEPMLGAVILKGDLDHFTGPTVSGYRNVNYLTPTRHYTKPGLDWVICGGESGPNARPMHPDWVRSLRDQCKAANVPFFFKQWGEWACEDGIYGSGKKDLMKVGKKNAGKLLDGQEYIEVPE